MRITGSFWLSVIVLFVSCGFAPGARAASPAASQADLDTVRLQLKWHHQFQFAGYYAALAKGYYREAGLHVVIREAAEGKDPVEEVTKGRADFGIGNSELVVLRSQGIPVVVLAAIYQHSPFVLMVTKKSGIENIQELRGKKVAVEQRATELLAYLRQEGLALDKINRCPVPYDLGPLIRGEIDALQVYSTNEPFLLEEAGVDYRVFDPRAGGIDFYGDCLFTMEEQIRKHPDRTRAFLNASLKGWKYAMDHPAEIGDLIYRQYGQRKSRASLLFEAKATRRLITPEIIELGYINPGRWKYIADTYAELGLMPANYSLKGFLYERNPQAKLLRYYAVIAGLGLLLIVVGLIGLRFYVLSRRLRLAEERYRILVERSPFPISISSLAGGEIMFFNPRAAEAFRVDRSAVIGQQSSHFYGNPPSRSALVERVEQQGSLTEEELLMRRADGEDFWALLSISQITFEGKPALFAAFSEITARKKTEAERDRLIAELQTALSEIKRLSGLIPICCSCKRIRDDEGYWQQVEAYISQHAGVQFTHGFCPECAEKLYPGYTDGKDE